MNPLRIGAVLLLAGTTILHAQTQGEPSALGPASDPALWLGLTPETAYTTRGAPAEVFPLEVADQTWQAVHFYPDHSYLFWASNRVWQVRLDRLWTGTLQGVAMGTPRADVEALFGEPVARGDTWTAWNLPYKAFPRRLRLVFTDEVLTDAYVYRSEL